MTDSDAKSATDPKKPPTASSRPAAAKTQVVKPQAELVPRRHDEILNDEELSKLELFKRLKKAPSVQKFPGSIILRFFPKGAAICRQGDRGSSAFYILSTTDLLELRRCQRDKYQEASSDARGDRAETVESLENQIRQLAERQERSAKSEEASAARQVATAYILSAGRPVRRRMGIFGYHKKNVSSVPRSSQRSNPQFIPNDGPRDVDYRTRQAPMYEGDVFGEMSCMTFAPRSATVVANEDCYMVEFLRNMFDQFQKDVGYRNWIDKHYEARVLDTHLRRLEFFQGLATQELETIRPKVSLEVFDPGMVICDEGEPSDGAYVIRSGLIRVIKGLNVLLRPTDVLDWNALCKELLFKDPDTGTSDGGTNSPASQKPASAPTVKPAKDKSALEKATASKSRASPGAKGATDAMAMLAARKAAKPAGSPKQKIWSLLPKDFQQRLEAIADGSEITQQDKATAIEALHELMRDRAFLASKELESIVKHDHVQSVIGTFPKGIKGIRKDWSDVDVRVCGRAVLEVLFPKCLPERDRWASPPHTLAYLSRGDCFGEMGVMTDQPRNATCIAYDHPPDETGRKPGRVELVKIPAEVFRQLLESSGDVRQRVNRLATQRRLDTQKQIERAPWLEEDSVLTVPEAREQGFVQGQKLFLIDLDKCTRCGDCVRACINTHDDGYSRLFLDGPRFDRFLVPSACRNCLDPACMIGCPVGSIQRGENGQIEIRDWCIGCGLCARQCPYDSIQMHDAGLIASQSPGWRFAPESMVAGQRWEHHHYNDRTWPETVGPLVWNLDLQAELVRCAPDAVWQLGHGEFVEPVLVRRSFDVVESDNAERRDYKLTVTSEGLNVNLWVNGGQVELNQDARQKKKGEADAVIRGKLLRREGNVVAIKMAPPRGDSAESDDVFAPDYGATILSLRLDPIPTLEDAPSITSESTQKLEVELVNERAVVCDLCSSLPSQEPACVTMCPHEAAIRINARYEFPTS